MKLSDFKINQRVFAVLVFPLIGMLLFSGYLSVQQFKISSENKKLAELVHVAPAIGNVIHQVQNERGASAGYIGSNGGREFAQQLATLTRETDQSYTALKNKLAAFDAGAYSDEFSFRLDKALSQLDKIEAAREDVKALRISTPEMAQYYTGTIESLISIISYSSRLSTDADITRTIAAYDSFINAKEKMGLERATGASGLGAGVFSPAAFQKFVSLIAQEDAYLSRFKALAVPELVEFYGQTVTGPAVLEVQKMREIILAAGSGTSLEGRLSASQWFETVTADVGLMKQVEDHVAEYLDSSVTTLQSAVQARLYQTLTMSSILLALAIGFGIILVNSITRPLAKMKDGLKNLADGNLDFEITGTERKDEIGEIAQTMLVFKENAEEKIRLQKEQEEAEKRQEEARRKMMNDMADQFDTDVGGIIKSVSDAAEEMQNVAAQLASAVEQTSHQSSSVSAASQQASANVQTVAAAAEELSASIQEITRNVADTADTAKNCADTAQVSQASLDELQDAVNEIDAVIQAINDVAEQTNLLALNATIEAARAGDAGKGFAVVASEVKQLAGQTHRMTDEIAQKVQNIKGSAATTISSMASILDQITSVDEKTANVASAVEEQNVSTNEISRNVQQAAAGTNEVSRNIEGIQQAANDSASSTEQLKSSSDNLARQAHVLQTAVGTFLTKVREG